MTLLREVYAVIGQGDVPLPGIGEAGTQPPRRVWQSRAKVWESSMSCGFGTHSPKAIGGGAINRILLRSKEIPARNRSSRSAACSGLRPWSRSLVPSMMISRSVSAGKAGAAAGISRPFCPMLKIVHPVSAAKMSTHRLPVS